MNRRTRRCWILRSTTLWARPPVTAPMVPNPPTKTTSETIDMGLLRGSAHRSWFPPATAVRSGPTMPLRRRAQTPDPLQDEKKPQPVALVPELSASDKAINIMLEAAERTRHLDLLRLVATVALLVGAILLVNSISSLNHQVSQNHIGGLQTRAGICLELKADRATLPEFCTQADVIKYESPQR